MYDKFITKKSVLIISLFTFAIFVIATVVQSTCDFKALGLCWLYGNQTWQVIELLIISAPLFLLSVVAYFMRNEVFDSWAKFALWWVPLSLVLVLVSPENNPSLLPINEKMPVSFAMSTLFFIISIVIIIAKRISLSTKK